MLGNWVRCTTTTTGTGSLTLSSVSNYPTFNDVFGTSRYFQYTILDDATGEPLETGIGHLSASTTLVRDRVAATYTGGTYDNTAPSALSLAAGTKRVICSAEEGVIMPGLHAVQASAGSKIVLPEGIDSSSGATKTLAANVPRASCLYWPAGREIASLCCTVITAAGTGTDRIQLGVYACTEAGGIGPLLCRTSDIAPNSTGFKSASLSGGNFRLLPGWYWFAIASNVGPVVHAYNAGAPGTATRSTPMGHASSSIHDRLIMFTLTSLTGGWTQLDSSTALVSGVSISTDFMPVVGGVLA